MSDLVRSFERRKRELLKKEFPIFDKSFLEGIKKISKLHINKNSFKSPLLKSKYQIKFKKAVIILTTAFVLSSVVQTYLDFNKSDPTMVQELDPSITLPNQDVPRDENGLIIVDPVVDEELLASYNFLNKSLLSHMSYFNIYENRISSLLSINEFDLHDSSYNETHGNKKYIEILLSTEKSNYLLRYQSSIDPAEIIDTDINDTQTLSSMIAFLQSCYKDEVLTFNRNEEVLIGSAFDYIPKQANLQEIRFPVYYYDNNSSTVSLRLYAILLNDIYANGANIEDANTLLNEYLDGKNNLFKEVDVGSNDKLMEVKEAYSYASELTLQSPSLEK